MSTIQSATPSTLPVQCGCDVPCADPAVSHFSPAGDSRSRPVPCWGCGTLLTSRGRRPRTMVWTLDGLCDAHRWLDEPITRVPAERAAVAS